MRLRWLFTFILLVTETAFAQTSQPDAEILREVSMWKLFPQEKVTISFFHCAMVQDHCKRLKVTDGFFKAYFQDGFVLTLSRSGRVLEHYYSVSKNNEEAFNKSISLYKDSNSEGLPEEIKNRISMRIEDMNRWLRGEQINPLSAPESNDKRLKETLSAYWVKFKQSDPKEKEKTIKEVASIFKENPRLAEMPEEARRHIVVANMLYERKEFEKAIEECKRALEIAPFLPIAFKGLAKSYGNLNLYELAIENMKYFLELLPNAPDARECKDEIYKWEYLLKGKNK